MLIDRNWCRSCGQSVPDASSPECPLCGIPLRATPESGVIGRTVDVRRKLLGSRPGVIIPGGQNQIMIHVGGEKPISPDSVKYEMVGAEDDEMPPVCRLYNRASSMAKPSWDSQLLRNLALAMTVNDVASARALCDQALALEDINILMELNLTPSEKAWRTAHAAAVVGDLNGLVGALGQLPDQGYTQRVDLLLPYAHHLRAHADMLRPLLDRWETGLFPGLATIAALVLGTPREALNASLILGTDSPLPDTSVDVEKQLIILSEASKGAALRAYHKGVKDRVCPTREQLAQLPIPLLEDLIDCGVVNQQTDLSALDTRARRVAQARLTPYAVPIPDLVELGHMAELARRYFLARDGAALDNLEETPDVGHYRALRAVQEGFSPQQGQLRPEVVDVIDLAKKDVARLADAPGDASAQVRADPTTWPLLAEVAREGRLLAGTHDDFGRWAAMHRLVGLLWDGKDTEAIDLGRSLADGVQDEIERDEILNLTAFAMDRLGRPDEALRTLESALEGAYTHNLLINASVIAKKANPYTAMMLLGRLIREAPSDDLRVAAMRSGLEVWLGTPDPELPPTLQDAMPQVLNCDSKLEDFHFLLRQARQHTPHIVLQVPPREGDHGGVLRLSQGHAQLATSDSFTLPDLAEVYSGLYREFGRCPWFDSEWDKLSSELREGMFVEFGTVPALTLFWKHILESSPDLLSEENRIEMLPQVGAHMTAYLAKQDQTLALIWYPTYFFDVYEQLLEARHRIDPGSFDYLSMNLSRCMLIAALHTYSENRDRIASTYNALVERVRWDAENRFAIKMRMRETLELTNEPLDLMDRLLSRVVSLKSADPKVLDLLQAITRDRDAWRDEIRHLRSNL